MKSNRVLPYPVYRERTASKRTIELLSNPLSLLKGFLSEGKRVYLLSSVKGRTFFTLNTDTENVKFDL